MPRNKPAGKPRTDAKNAAFKFTAVDSLVDKKYFDGANNEVGTNLALASKNIELAKKQLYKKAGTLRDMQAAKLSAAFGAQTLFSILEHIPPSSKDYARIARVRDGALAIALELDHRITTESNLVHHPEITKPASAVKPGAKASVDGQTMDAEDAVIYNKILGCIVNKACGLRGFDTYVGGQDFAERFRITAIERFNRPHFKSEHSKLEGYLLVGPPGTGKTLLAEAIAAELAPQGAVFLSLTPSVIKDKYVGGSEKSIGFIFDIARKATMQNGVAGMHPAVIYFDEMDGLLDNTNSGGGTGLLAEINAQMEGLRGGSNEGLIVVGSTNYPERIPEAATSRFPQKIFVGLPEPQEVREILLLSLNKMGIPRVDMEVHWERKKFMSVGGGIVDSKALDDAKKKGGDDVDILASYCCARNYAPRDIDAVVNMVKYYSEARSLKFIGVLESDSADETVQRQMWLLDRRSFQHKREVDKKCILETVQKSYLIPLYFCNTDGTPVKPADLGTSMEVGSVNYAARLLRDTTGKKHWLPRYGSDLDVRLIMTERRRVSAPRPTTAAATTPGNPASTPVVPAMQWKYTIVKSFELNEKALEKRLALDAANGLEPSFQRNPDPSGTYQNNLRTHAEFLEILGVDDLAEKDTIPTSGKWVEWDTRKEAPLDTDITSILGLSQVTMQDFYLACDHIKAVEIKNAQDMFDYADKFCISLKDNKSDIVRVGALAKSQKETARKDLDPSEMKQADLLTAFMNAVVERQAGQEYGDGASVGRAEDYDMTSAVGGESEKKSIEKIETKKEQAARHKEEDRKRVAREEEEEKAAKAKRDQDKMDEKALELQRIQDAKDEEEAEAKRQFEEKVADKRQALILKHAAADVVRRKRQAEEMAAAEKEESKKREQRAAEDAAEKAAAEKKESARLAKRAAEDVKAQTKKDAKLAKHATVNTAVSEQQTKELNGVEETVDNDIFHTKMETAWV